MFAQRPAHTHNLKGTLIARATLDAAKLHARTLLLETCTDKHRCCQSSSDGEGETHFSVRGNNMKGDVSEDGRNTASFLCPAYTYRHDSDQSGRIVIAISSPSLRLCGDEVLVTAASNFRYSIEAEYGMLETLALSQSSIVTFKHAEPCI